ncbi:MAG TPA: dTDP-4-dehydrorhamnose reductase [Rhodanobacteraceae bacterium]|nr:dTDP-4-dehydrorhamnose reductase [Rhodanobacteraceae bacterium]
METILLLGANGQVGFELRRTLAPLGALVAATRSGEILPGAPCERADLVDAAALAALLERVRPGLIVNAAAYTAVDRAETEPALAARVNGEAVGEIGRWAAANDAAVLHYSTDYVFAGDADRAYAENDTVAPLGSYGRSKLAGDQALAASGAAHLILRTAWVYAARGHNFLRSMLRLAAERDELRVVADQVGSPTPAALIAEVSAQLLARWLPLEAAERHARGGVYHLTSNGHTSWCDFARAIVAGASARGLLARTPPVTAISSAEYPTPARRPAWSVLDCRRLQTCFGVHLPDWQDGLATTLTDMQASSGC